MSKLILCSVPEMRAIQPAVLYEREAALYLKLSIHAFRELVRQGEMSFTAHVGRKRRIYLKADLDNYLNQLPRCNMVAAKIHRNPTDKG